jgi:RimJ/RimL family protein N-acetyltransferase
MKRGQAFQRFPLGSRWRERIMLRDGRELLLRPIHAADIEPIRNGFALLGADEIRMRYQHPVKSLAEDYLQRLTQPRRGREFVLVLAEPLPPGEALVGAVARLSRDEGSNEAGFAILVSHYLSGVGLGRLLMTKLITFARRRGLRAIHGDVLDDNTPMLRLAESLGFRREATDHPGSLRVRLALTHQDDRTTEVGAA